MTRTTMLVFSFNRPMQLDLLLRSFYKSVNDLENVDVNILYNFSNEDFEAAYKICQNEHSKINFILQDFFYKEIKNFTKNSLNDFILFCTDDTIFTNNFSISEIESVFDLNDSLLNFSLRLGANTTYCYPLHKKQFPRWTKRENNVFYWDWRSGEFDFGYPLEVSSTVLRLKDVKKFIDAWTFPDPNWMEWYMDMSKNVFVDKYLSACFPISVAFSAPMNKVKASNKNRSSAITQYSTKNLVALYLKGYRINAECFSGYVSSGAHEEVTYDFIQNKEKNE